MRRRIAEGRSIGAIGAIVDARIGADAYPPLRRLHTALAPAQAVPTDAIARREMAAGRSGPAVGAAIHAARVEAVAAVSAA